MLDKTLGYILCCQSPALFLAALALLVAYLAGRKHKVRAFFRLLLCILCAAGGVALYFLGIYKEYFTIRDFFLIRTAGWIGLAIAAFFVLLALVGGTVIWIGLLHISPVLAKKMMALLSVITFPTLSCLLVMKPEKRSVGKSVLALLAMCALSYIGAVLMVGLLADVLFMLKLDGFMGVKIAHVIPIVAVPFILYIWKAEKPIATVKQLLDKALDYKWALLGAVVAVAGFIYISRTGNTTAELSTGEAAMRNFLNDVMGVRPRSKEFLIGYPLTLLLFWLGASKRNWILTIPAVIGQVSLVNTYAHIHTALLMSLQRSFNGLVLGIVLGVLLLLAVQLLLKIYHRLEQKEGSR